MGILKKENRALKEIRKEKIENYLKELNELNKKYNLIRIPIIGRYGAAWEIHEIDEKGVKPEPIFLETQNS